MRTFALVIEKGLLLGRLAEWLGTGLQNRLRRFESATDLKETNKCLSLFLPVNILYSPASKSRYRAIYITKSIVTSKPTLSDYETNVPCRYLLY